MTTMRDISFKVDQKIMKLCQVNVDTELLV